MPDYDIMHTSRHTAEVNDIVLSDEGDDSGAATRKILRMELVNNIHDRSSAVKACIMHQRRHSRKDDWRDANAFSLATLHAGQEVRLQLGCDETLRLYRALRDMYVATSGGIPEDDQHLAVVDPDAVISATGQEKRAIAQILERGTESLWDAINELQPDALAAIGRAKLHESRRRAYEEFAHHLEDDDWREGEWERFFRENQWIFGYGLAYRFLSEVQGQPHYGGTSVTGTGGQRGDFLMATEAKARFTVLVDIKTPSSPLIGRLYRNQAYAMGHELVGAVSQLQSNCRTWAIDGSQRETNEDLAAERIFTYEPKAILVIGTTAQLDDRNRRASFELFRRNLHNPEILIYDELLARARFVVNVEEAEEQGDDPEELVDDGFEETHDIDLQDLVNYDAMEAIATERGNGPR